MEINIIAAVSDNNVIGKDGKLPWHIPEDLKRFKKLTLGHTVVMGRKTFESLGSKPLSDRVNCVISETLNDVVCLGMQFFAFVYDNIQQFLDEQKEIDDEVVWIIGGSNIYREFMPHAQRMYITRVHQTIEDGDAFFPEIDLNVWHLEHFEKHNGFDFEVYSK